MRRAGWLRQAWLWLPALPRSRWRRSCRCLGWTTTRNWQERSACVESARFPLEELSTTRAAASDVTAESPLLPSQSPVLPLALLEAARSLGERVVVMNSLREPPMGLRLVVKMVAERSCRSRAHVATNHLNRMVAKARARRCRQALPLRRGADFHSLVERVRRARIDAVRQFEAGWDRSALDPRLKVSRRWLPPEEMQMVALPWRVPWHQAPRSRAVAEARLGRTETEQRRQPQAPE